MEEEDDTEPAAFLPFPESAAGDEEDEAATEDDSTDGAAAAATAAALRPRRILKVKRGPSPSGVLGIAFCRIRGDGCRQFLPTI